ncbi:MAG: class I SAM-dependent methyltransferase [Alphaproteobacteria bacterium]
MQLVAKRREPVDLYSYFIAGRKKHVLNKWHHFFEVYERFLGPLRDRRPVNMLEIGVYKGGSLEMWRKYFGPRSRIYGLDFNPECKQYEDDGIEIYIGEQTDRALLQRIAADVGRLDVVLDDGSHAVGHQITTFEELYPRLAEDGIYMVEDTFTSLWGGEFQDREDGETFMTFAFKKCLSLMEWTGRAENLGILGSPENGKLLDTVSEFCRTTKAIHFYDSIVVFERGRREVPRHEIR